MSRRGLWRVAVLFFTALTLGACSSALNTPSSTTSTLAPAPPAVIGLVSLIGTGSGEGSGSGMVAVNLSSSAHEQRSIATGTFPDAIAIAPKLRRAYVTNYDSNDVTPIDLDTGKVEKAIAVGAGPAGIAIAPNEKMAYVTDAGSSPLGDTVTPINLKTGKALAPITVGAGPQAIAITPDGAMAYVTDAGAIVTGQNGAIGHQVTPIDLRTRRALAPISVGNAPVAIALMSDGSLGFVANEYSGSVTPIDLSNNQPGTPIELPGAPDALALAGGGSTLWVALGASSVASGNSIVPIDTSSDASGTPIGPCKSPSSLAIAAGTAYVVCAAAIVPIDLATHTLEVTKAIPISGGPYAIAITSDAKVLETAVNSGASGARER